MHTPSDSKMATGVRTGLTAARHDPAGSARAFSSEAALPAVRALNGAGGPTLLPAMHRIVNAVQPGLISPEAALYGYWMECARPTGQAGPCPWGTPYG